MRAGTALAVSGPDSLPEFPRLVGPRHRAGACWARNFRDAPEAAGGVLGVDAGLGVAMAWRSHYPRSLDRSERWLPFHEFTLAWDGNRYTTAQRLTPGRSSDVVFHRLTLAYGIGRLSPDRRYADEPVAGGWAPAPCSTAPRC